MRHHGGVIELHTPRACAAVDAGRGGRLAGLAVDGRELLVGPPDAADRGLGWGCFLMAPWAGRIAGGRLSWHGHLHRLPLSVGPDALHGVVYDRPWTIEQATPTEVVLGCRLTATPCRSAARPASD